MLGGASWVPGTRQVRGRSDSEWTAGYLRHSRVRRVYNFDMYNGDTAGSWAGVSRWGGSQRGVVWHSGARRSSCFSWSCRYGLADEEWARCVESMQKTAAAGAVGLASNRRLTREVQWMASATTSPSLCIARQQRRLDFTRDRAPTLQGLHTPKTRPCLKPVSCRSFPLAPTLCA